MLRSTRSLIEQLGFKNLAPNATMTLGQIPDREHRPTTGTCGASLKLDRGRHRVQPRHRDRPSRSWKSVLKVIDELEPAGVGSPATCRSACCSSCVLDAPSTARHSRLAMKILTKDFDEFTKKHYEKLMSRLERRRGSSSGNAIEEIVRLSPKPGNLYSGGTQRRRSPKITPDFTLGYQNGMFELSLNGVERPRPEGEPALRGEMIREHGDPGRAEPTDGPDTRGDPVRQEQDRLGQMVHLGDQAAARHADAYDAGDTGLSARVLHRRRPVEVAPDDPQGHRRPRRISTYRRSRAW